MKGTTMIFVCLGLIFFAAVIFAFIYLPKMADASGIENQDIVLSMPVDSTLMRYSVDGVVPFCLENSNGIGVQVKENAPILTPISGVISQYYIESNRVVISVSSKVSVHVKGVGDLNYAVGDYVLKGDILGYSSGSNILLILENLKNERYECPFLYMDEYSQRVVANGLEYSTYSTENICECPSIDY